MAGKLQFPGAPEATTPQVGALTTERGLSYKYPEGDEATKAKIDAILAKVDPTTTTADALLSEINALEGVTAEYK